MVLVAGLAATRGLTSSFAFVSDDAAAEAFSALTAIISFVPDSGTPAVFARSGRVACSGDVSEVGCGTCTFGAACTGAGSEAAGSCFEAPCTSGVGCTGVGSATGVDSGVGSTAGVGSATGVGSTVGAGVGFGVGFEVCSGVDSRVG